MASNITKDAAVIRYNAKSICRSLLTLKEAIDSLIDQSAAGGVFFDGSVPGITADAEAASVMFALQQVQAALNTNKTNLFKGADVGGNIPAPVQA